jgi:hypothetical protein
MTAVWLNPDRWVSLTMAVCVVVAGALTGLFAFLAWIYVEDPTDPDTYRLNYARLCIYAGFGIEVVAAVIWIELWKTFADSFSSITLQLHATYMFAAVCVIAVMCLETAGLPSKLPSIRLHRPKLPSIRLHRRGQRQSTSNESPRTVLTGSENGQRHSDTKLQL